jgi:hypothetical protein
MNPPSPMANTQPMHSILVLGAGELGMAVLRPLAIRAAAAGVSIAVLLRPETIGTTDASKRADIDELLELGCEPLPGDIASASVAELADRFGRHDTVLSCIGFAAGRGTQLKLAKAALQAKVRRYFPWQFGVDYDVLGRGSPQDLFDEQLDVRDLLRGQDEMEWVIVSNGIFTSFLFEPAFGVVDLAANTVRALGSWENAVTATTPEDIGRLTTEILFAEPRIANQIVHVAGDTVTYGQIADIVDRQLGREVERVLWDVPKLQAELAHDPDNAMKKYQAVFAKGPGMAWDMATTFNHRRGIAVTSVEDWVRENLSGAKLANPARH